MAKTIKEKYVLEFTGDPSDLQMVWKKMESNAQKAGHVIGEKVSGGTKKASFAMNALATASGFVFAQMTMAAGRFVKNGIVTVVSEAANLEYTLTKAAVIAGGGFEEMEKKARAVGAATAFTATQAAEGLFMLASQGHDTAQSLGEVQAMMELAGATSSDLATSFRFSALQMRIFGADVSQVRDLVDVLATGTLKAAFTSLNEFSTTMTYASPAGAAFGYSLQETTAAASAFMNVLGQSSMAGTQFRMVMMKLGDENSKANQILKKYGVQAVDTAGNVKNLADIIDEMAKKGVTASEIVQGFGARASTGMLALVATAREGTNEIARMQDEIDKAGGTTESVYKKMMDTLSGAWKIMKSQALEFGLEIFNTFGQLPKIIVSYLGDAFTKVKEWFIKIKKDNENFVTDAVAFVQAKIEFLIDATPTYLKLALSYIKKFTNEVKTEFQNLKVTVGGMMESISLPGFGGIRKAGSEMQSNAAQELIALTDQWQDYSHEILKAKINLQQLSEVEKQRKAEYQKKYTLPEKRDMTYEHNKTDPIGGRTMDQSYYQKGLRAQMIATSSANNATNDLTIAYKSNASAATSAASAVRQANQAYNDAINELMKKFMPSETQMQGKTEGYRQSAEQIARKKAENYQKYGTTTGRADVQTQWEFQKKQEEVEPDTNVPKYKWQQFKVDQGVKDWNAGRGDQVPPNVRAGIEDQYGKVDGMWNEPASSKSLQQNKHATESEVSKATAKSAKNAEKKTDKSVKTLEKTFDDLSKHAEQQTKVSGELVDNIKQTAEILSDHQTRLADVESTLSSLLGAA